MLFEFSAGGVVVDGGSVLVVAARDLKGRRVWTFPKGLVEKGESSLDAALREVREETGYRCEVAGELPKAEYWYWRDGQRIKKAVRWFVMRPLERVGDPDAVEIEEAAWVEPVEADRRLTYPGDRALLREATKESTAR